MKINTENIEKCIILLKKHFYNQNNKDLANVEVPESINDYSEKWLYYIFYSCLLDYGMRSKIYHKNLILTYNKYPEIFSPKYIVENFNNKEHALFKIIKDNIHPRYPNIAIKKWIHLSNELNKYGSLLAKIKNFKNYDELNLFIKNINGYGQKTGGLLIRLLFESNILTFKDEMSSIPLDRHDIEISYLNGIIDTKKLSANQISELSTNFINFGKKYNVSAIDVDKYLWQIGNDFCNKHNCLDCPLNINCKTK